MITIRRFSTTSDTAAWSPAKSVARRLWNARIASDGLFGSFTTIIKWHYLALSDTDLEKASLLPTPLGDPKKPLFPSTNPRSIIACGGYGSFTVEQKRKFELFAAFSMVKALGFAGVDV